MSLLKKENWLVCLILSIISEGVFTLVLAYIMKLYDKKSWYAKWQYWVFGTLCLFFPVLIMAYVFMIQMTTKVASNLEVPGKEIYTSPYSWILCLVVPVLGWSLMIVMLIYINVWTIVALYKGNGEKFLNQTK